MWPNQALANGGGSSRLQLARLVAAVAELGSLDKSNTRMRNSFLTLLLVLTSCGPMDVPGPGLQDFEYPLSGGYILSRTSADQIQIHPHGGWDNKTPMVHTKVVQVAWNDRWILAKRQQLRVENVFDFWILDTKERELYGPLDELSFGSKRNELGLPDALKLKDVYAYK